MADLYVDTDNGNNANNGTSWALAKANLNNACAAIPASISTPYIVHCRGTAADTVGVNFNHKGSSAVNTITIQTDAADRHAGVWDQTKYRLELTDAWPFTTANLYTNIIGLQVKLRMVSVSYIHAISLSIASSGVINIGHNIIWGDIVGSIDSVGVHSNYNGVVNLYNNIIYGFVNGTNSGLAAAALYCPSTVFNNTFVNCRQGIYFTNNSVNDVLAKNNLFVDVNTAATGYQAAFAAGSDYNSTSSASMGLSVTGGGNTHDRTSVSTSGLFVAGTYLLARGATRDVVDAGVTDPSGSGVFSDDILGTARPKGAAWDRGAHELIEGRCLILKG